MATADQRRTLSPELQASYDAAVEEWRSGRRKGEPPDDVEALERELAELRAQVEP